MFVRKLQFAIIYFSRIIIQFFSTQALRPTSVFVTAVFGDYHRIWTLDLRPFTNTNLIQYVLRIVIGKCMSVNLIFP